MPQERSIIGSRLRRSIRENYVAGSRDNDLLGGLVRLRILHHSIEGDLCGHWMIEELARQGDLLSPGTLYPMLHAMKRKGYLKSKARGTRGRARRT